MVAKRAITKPKIIEALHSGVRTASKRYARWSGGLTLAKSPEYFVLVEIARKIERSLGDSERLRLEMQYTEVLTGADFVQGPGRPLASIGGTTRADLVLLKKNGQPTCVVEVKKDPTTAGLERDLSRLSDIVYACRHKDGILKHGFLSIYESGDAESTVRMIRRFFEKSTQYKARAKAPTVTTWGEEQASIVVEVTAKRN